VESNRAPYLDSGLLGTGTPNALAGCHKITALSGNNVTLTVKYVGTLPALTITGGWVVFCPTQLKFTNTTGLVVSNSYITISNMCVIGNNITGTTGISNTANSELKMSKIGVAEFKYGLLLPSACFSSVDFSCFSGNEIGILSSSNGFVLAAACAFVGNSKGGAHSSGCSNISIGESAAFGNGIMDYYATNSSFVTVSNMQATNISPALNVVGNGNACITSFSAAFY
jgi:hypothetical protein